MSQKLKIELETYVQMTYFDQILRKANLRFMTMSDGQYELKRQEASGKNLKVKTGLDLNVIDHYNGTERSVRTLSGGESFQASLWPLAFPMRFSRTQAESSSMRCLWTKGLALLTRNP